MAGLPQQEDVIVARQMVDIDAQRTVFREPSPAALGQTVISTKKELPQTNDSSILPQLSSESPIPQNTNVTSDTTMPRAAVAHESQPMTAASSASSSSLPALQMSGTNEATTPSPYGTRSRNRTNSNRPNYAEDREVDADFEYTTSKKTQSVSTSNAAQVAEVDKPVSFNRRRSIQGSSGSNLIKAGGAGATSSKDHIPGMSSFSVHSDTNGTTQSQSKKRKAPGSQIASANGSTQASGPGSYKTTNHANSLSGAPRETNMMSFETSQAYLKQGKLVSDDGTSLGLNDYVYLVCEPPGDPYYIARIMEFLHANNNDPTLHIESIRINWVYRPRDISCNAPDTRLLFTTMHTDIVPITSLRGSCTVKHRDEIPSLDDYRKEKNCFYYSQLYDRYMRRRYDVIPTKQVINVPERVKKVLDERWSYVLVEVGRGKDLTSAIKSCKRCAGYCASNNSVDCAMCKNTYHMDCVRPALQKKPARGFAWSCGPCSRKQERKLEARNTPLVSERGVDGDDEELVDEEEEEHGAPSYATSGSSPTNTIADGGIRPATKDQLAITKAWPVRYLGVHCKPEDVLDYDDRIYPRASSRLGPRHQANVLVWHGHALKYVKPSEIKRKYLKGSGHKKDTKLSKDTVVALEAEKIAKEKRPKWVIDEPPGFVHRGDDHPNNDPANTAKLLFRLPQVGESSSRGGDSESAKLNPNHSEEIVDHYMAQAKRVAKALGVQEYSTNFLDKAIQCLHSNGFDEEAALSQLRTTDPRKDLKEPKLTKEDVKKFEEGVAMHGNNLHEVTRHVFGNPKRNGEIVRFYYMWKKTERGKQIWGNFHNRKVKKGLRSDGSLLDDVADDADDSAFDNDKAAVRKRGFECKFCFTRQSRFWRRAPSTAPGETVHVDSGTKGSKDKAVLLMVALCHRCAGLWRKYAIQWENVDEVARKVAQAGGRAFKRKMDEELLIELVNANAASSVGMSSTAIAAAASVGVTIPPSLTIQPEQGGARKKLKMVSEIEPSLPTVNSNPVESPKKKVAEKPPEPPLVPEEPRFKTLACSVCNEMEPLGEEHFCCRYCRLTVHRGCYGIPASKSAGKWTCDMCSNDLNGHLSTSYECVLCPEGYTEYELLEPPKASHKKKTDREREKERLEKELVVEFTNNYRQRQYEAGRPACPREPLKQTSGNNWVHVVCAVWTPGIKFSLPERLEAAEGLGSIPQSRYQQVCKLCKKNTGVCVTCHKCPATFHVTCAQKHGYSLGFDITPVKGSRRDVINTITLGTEAGNAEAVVYCKDHSVKSILHPMHEFQETYGYNALQAFVRNYKQADVALTGTVRKAAIINSFIRSAPQSTSVNGHKGSISNGPSNGVDTPPSGPATRSSRVSPAAVTVKSEEVDEDGDRVVHLNEPTTFEPNFKECWSCGTKFSPKWHVKKGVSTISNLLVTAEFDKAPHSEVQVLAEANMGARQFTSIENSGSKTFAPNSSLVAAGGSVGEALANGTAYDDERRVEVPLAAAMLKTETPTSAMDVLDATRDYLCHQCHLKKLKEPSPQPSIKQAEQPSGVVRSVSHEAQTIEVQAPLPPTWVSAVSLRQPQVESRPGQALPPTEPPVRLVNGVSHSPPQHVVGHPQPQYTVVPPPYYGSSYEPREQHHLSSVQHHTNGVPPAYQIPRNMSGPPEQLSYSAHNQVHGPSQYARPTSNGTRSPPVHYRAHQPPLRPTEDPFFMPSNNTYEQRPVLHHRRPTTPPEGSGRNGGWVGNEGPMVNGASANPSLRNLLH